MTFFILGVATKNLFWERPKKCAILGVKKNWVYSGSDPKNQLFWEWYFLCWERPSTLASLQSPRDKLSLFKFSCNFPCPQGSQAFRVPEASFPFSSFPATHRLICWPKLKMSDASFTSFEADAEAKLRRANVRVSWFSIFFFV